MGEKNRRTRGDGSLYQRADGVWLGRVELPPGRNGIRRQRTVSSRDRNTALTKLKKLRKEVDDGTLAVTGNTTVEKWMTRWLDDIHGPRIRPHTLLNYRSLVDNHIVPTLGKKRLDKLTTEHVRDLHAAVGASRTAVLAHTVLQKALKDAVREQMITRNVCELVDKPTYAKRKRTSMSAAVAKRILTTADSSCDESQAARWWAAFYTGGRQGELLGLRWQYVDLENAFIDIQYQLQRLKQIHGCGDPQDGIFPCGLKYSGRCPQRKWDQRPDFEYEVCEGSLAFTPPKSDAGRRLVPIVTPLLVRLKAMHANQGRNPHGLVWHDGGKPIDHRADSRRWNELLLNAGIVEEGETIPLHTARHTTATVLRASGVDEQTRMEILGHATVDSQRIYAHTDLQRLQLAMANLKQLEP
jgi:integrase